MTTTDTLRARLSGKPGLLGATCTLASGGYFDFIDPKPETVFIEDIAAGLAKAARFGGQSRRPIDGHFGCFYSVAQHSCLVSEMVEPEHRFAALMHDAAEGYMGDMVGPLKQLIPDFKVIENRVEEAIFARFGIAAPLHASIKHADLRALRTEQRDLSTGRAHNWNGLDQFEPHPETIVPWEPEQAYRLFIDAFDRLNPAKLGDGVGAISDEGSPATDDLNPLGGRSDSSARSQPKSTLHGAHSEGGGAGS